MKAYVSLILIATLYVAADAFRIFQYWDAGQVRPLLMFFSGGEWNLHLIDYAWEGSSAAFLAFFHDDFFYYVKIAENFLETGRFTFDGITETNGFHPLWMMILLGIRALAGTEHGFFIAAYLLSQLLCLFGALSLYRLLSRQRGNSPVVIASSLLYFFLGSQVSQGMETSLVFAIFPWFLSLTFRHVNQPASWQLSILWGFAASMLVLSRLDSVVLVFFVGAVLGCLSLRHSLWQSFRFCLWGGLGALPFVFYLIWNLLSYGEAVPISGLAKGLKQEPGISIAPLKSVFLEQGFISLWVWLLTLLSVFGLLQLKQLHRSLGSVALCLAVLYLFPALFLLTTGWRSDWPLWPWYTYPWVLAGCTALGLMGQGGNSQSGRRLLDWRSVVAVVGIASIFGSLLAGKYLMRPPTRIWLATEIKQFMDEHPGRYAMGDHAGTVAYLANQPVVQLEGLVADRKMLEFIEAQKPLKAVLDHYQVDYYVATHLQERGPCFSSIEPRKGGASSPVMRGRFCNSPEYVIPGAEEAEPPRAIIMRVSGTQARDTRP